MTKRAPVPTTPPNAEQIAHRLSRRQDEMQICGYINQESDEPVFCTSGAVCATNPGGSVVGCCTPGSNCNPPTSCANFGATCDSACLTDPGIEICPEYGPLCQQAIWLGYQTPLVQLVCGTVAGTFTVWPSATDGGPIVNMPTAIAASSATESTTNTVFPGIASEITSSATSSSLTATPASPDTTASSTNSGSSGLTAGGIAGLAVGSFAGLAFLVLIVIGSVFLYRRRHPRRPSLPVSHGESSQLLGQSTPDTSSSRLSSWISASQPVGPDDSLSHVGELSSAHLATHEMDYRPRPPSHRHSQGATAPAPSEFGSIPPLYNPSVMS